MYKNNRFRDVDTSIYDTLANSSQNVVVITNADVRVGSKVGSEVALKIVMTLDAYDQLQAYPCIYAPPYKILSA